MQGGGAQKGPITVVLASLSSNNFGQARPIVPHTISQMTRPSTRSLRAMI